MTRLENIKGRWKKVFKASRKELVDFFGPDDVWSVLDLKWLYTELETVLVKLREAQAYTPPIISAGIEAYFKNLNKEDPQ